MSVKDANKYLVLSDISDLDESPRQSLIDPTPQTLYSTAMRYQETNKQTLFATLETAVKSRRYKVFYGILCVITFVISYQFIVYFQSDLSNNYSYKQPLFIQYISYSLFPVIIGLPLVHPLWIIGNKYHKSSSNTKIIISNNNNSKVLIKKKKKHRSFTHRKCEHKHSSAQSEITSTSYEFDEEYDENEVCLLDDVIMDKVKESATELGMISELSFNDLCRNKIHKNGIIAPYYKTTQITKTNLKTLSSLTRSECGILVEKNEDNINPNINCKKKEKEEKKHIIVRSNRDISRIPQSVYFKLDLPFRSFPFYFKKIGIYLFIVLFIMNALSSILWIKSIQSGIDIHLNGFYFENSIHCLRVIVCYINSCNDNISIIWRICCLLMLIFGLMTILYDNLTLFNGYNIVEIVILGLSPVFNGLLTMYLSYLSSKFVYKENIAMFLGDIVFILGINGLMNLLIIWIVLLISHYMSIEAFIMPYSFDIIWRLIVIAGLWWIYNVSLFIGIALLNAVIIGFGFALCIPFNILFDSIMMNDNDNIYYIALCLITAPFILYQIQFYVLYIMYCRRCIKKCSKCRTSFTRQIHKKTRYRLYGQCQSRYCCCLN